MIGPCKNCKTVPTLPTLVARSSCEKPWRSFFIVALCKQSECTWKVLHDTRTKTHSGEHYFLLQLNPRSNYFTFRALSGLLESKSNWGRLGQSLSQFVSDLSHPSGKSKERRKKEVNSDKARGDSCLIYLVREGSGYGEERGIKWRTHCTSTLALACNISYFYWVNPSGSLYFVCTFDYYMIWRRKAPAIINHHPSNKMRCRTRNLGIREDWDKAWAYSCLIYLIRAGSWWREERRDWVKEAPFSSALSLCWLFGGRWKPGAFWTQ